MTFKMGSLSRILQIDNCHVPSGINEKKGREGMYQGGDAGLQPACGGFDSHPFHQERRDSQ